MGTDVLAVVFLVGIIIMAATVAVMTVIYASRLPSSRQSPGSGSKADSHRDGKQAKVRKQRKVTAQRPPRNPPLALEQEESRDDPAPDLGSQTVESSQAPVDQTTDSNERRKPRSNMGLFFKRPKGEPMKETPKVDSSPTAPREAASSTEEKVSPAIQRSGENAPALPIAGQTPAEPAGEIATPGNQPVSSESVPVVPVGARRAEAANTTAIDTANPASAAKGNAAPAGPIPVPEKSPEPKTIKTPEDAKREKSVMGDLSELFAKNTSEDSKANKLAEGMAEVDVNDLVKEGVGLIGKLKKPER